MVFNTPYYIKTHYPPPPWHPRAEAVQPITLLSYLAPCEEKPLCLEPTCPPLSFDFFVPFLRAYHRLEQTPPCCWARGPASLHLLHRWGGVTRSQSVEGLAQVLHVTWGELPLSSGGRAPPGPGACFVLNLPLILSQDTDSYRVHSRVGVSV